MTGNTKFLKPGQISGVCMPLWAGSRQPLPCAETTLNPAFMAAVDVPTLAFMAGDEGVVDPAASRHMLAYLPDCHPFWFAEARHELLSELPEVTSRLYAELDQFLAADETDQRTTELGSA